jgi:phosphotransferase system  glucose/maltose/N-acetylglucosamine-specific IIC component
MNKKISFKKPKRANVKSWFLFIYYYYYYFIFFYFILFFSIKERSREEESCFFLSKNGFTEFFLKAAKLGFL